MITPSQRCSGPTVPQAQHLSANAKMFGVDDEEEYESEPAFVGPCTCDHVEERHGANGCTVRDCDCEAYWEE